MSAQSHTKSSKHHHHSSKHHSTSSSGHKQHYLITDTPVRSSDSTSEIDLQAESWKLPYSIDDSDLTFDGKPLNMLYEENRYEAEHHRESGDYHYSSSGGSSSGGRSEKEHVSILATTISMRDILTNVIEISRQKPSIQKVK